MIIRFFNCCPLMTCLIFFFLIKVSNGFLLILYFLLWFLLVFIAQLLFFLFFFFFVSSFKKMSLILLISPSLVCFHLTSKKQSIQSLENSLSCWQGTFSYSNYKEPADVFFTFLHLISASAVNVVLWLTEFIHLFQFFFICLNIALQASYSMLPLFLAYCCYFF